MRVYRRALAVLCTGVVLSNAPLARAQDATSANLPEHVETGEALPTPSQKKKKKAAPSRAIAARRSTQKPAAVTEQMPTEEPPTPALPVEKKTRVKKRASPAVQPEAASSLAVTSLSLPAAQAMALSAPLPEYPYQAKRANITGSGVCVITVRSEERRVGKECR